MHLEVVQKDDASARYELQSNPIGQPVPVQVELVVRQNHLGISSALMLALHVFFANQIAVDVHIHAAWVHSPWSEVANGQLDFVARCFDLVWQTEVDVEH